MQRGLKFGYLLICPAFPPQLVSMQRGLKFISSDVYMDVKVLVSMQRGLKFLMEKSSTSFMLSVSMQRGLKLYVELLAICKGNIVSMQRGLKLWRGGRLHLWTGIRLNAKRIEIRAVYSVPCKLKGSLNAKRIEMGCPAQGHQQHRTSLNAKRIESYCLALYVELSISVSQCKDNWKRLHCLIGWPPAPTGI